MATFQIKAQKIKTAATKITKSYKQQQLQQQRQVIVVSPSKTRRRRQQQQQQQESPQAALCGNYTQQQQIGFQCTQHHQQHHQHQYQHHHRQQEQQQQQQHCHLCSRSTSTTTAASTVALTRRRCPALGLTAIARLLPPPLGGFFSKFNFDPTDSLFMMITMLVVVTVVISGNAVFAAQRDSYKPKDLNSISNNANAIPNAISGTGNAASNGNTNNVSNGNTNSNSASSSNNTTTSTNNNSHDSNKSNSLTSGGNSATSTTTTTAVLTTAAHSTSSGSSSSSTMTSSSLQKSSGGSAGINRNTIEIQEDTRNGPYFDKAASKNVTALLGKTAYLNCRVKNLGNKTMLLQVSWVRHRDIHLLTVGRYTYTSDQRFRAIHQPQTEDWILQIKYPQHRDSGIYECQVSTTPHMSHYIHLNVVEPSTEIIGAPDLYIESGSTINLTCVILNSPEPPAYIFWNHNNAIINYDSPRGGVSVVTNKGETTTSFLLIKSARPSDSGHYQCNPSNAKPKSVTVHVLNGVSHSVSRGVPSSNAARGTVTSSNVSKSLSIAIPFDILLQFSVFQALYVAACASSQLMRKQLQRLLAALMLLICYVLAAIQIQSKSSTATKSGILEGSKCCCNCLLQVKQTTVEQQQQQQQQLQTQHRKHQNTLLTTTCCKSNMLLSTTTTTNDVVNIATAVDDSSNQSKCHSCSSRTNSCYCCCCCSSRHSLLPLLLRPYQIESDIR